MPAGKPTIVQSEAAREAADLRAARRVLRFAGEALALLSENLDGAFARAVGVLASVRGRVVVSGMGKSGHVGHKIAATFSSTGTPAQFVHPAEASHGDLGALAPQDALLLLSYSGETEELSNLITYAKRFGIPLIGMASQPESTLLKACDIALVLPRAQEACPMGLAPTTSTTLMLALGDALAVALMERKGFSADQYRDRHPGGVLGRALIRVSDLMHTKYPTVAPEAPMKDVLIKMTSFGEYGFAGVVGVVEKDGMLAGIVTDGDLRRQIHGNPLEQTAGDFMTRNPKTITADELAAEALKKMNDLRITCLFVLDGDARRPIGLIHIHDCLRAGLR
ncbi:MAG: KpsF/GutQ family sugar-phosphate isomerase [Alphaproteobacteria bacterium]